MNFFQLLRHYLPLWHCYLPIHLCIIICQWIFLTEYCVQPLGFFWHYLDKYLSSFKVIPVYFLLISGGGSNDLDWDCTTGSLLRLRLHAASYALIRFIIRSYKGRLPASGMGDTTMLGLAHVQAEIDDWHGLSSAFAGGAMRCHKVLRSFVQVTLCRELELSWIIFRFKTDLTKDLLQTKGNTLKWYLVQFL
jgi:hypothetical protein